MGRIGAVGVNLTVEGILDSRLTISVWLLKSLDISIHLSTNKNHPIDRVIKIPIDHSPIDTLSHFSDTGVPKRLVNQWGGGRESSPRCGRQAEEGWKAYKASVRFEIRTDDRDQRVHGLSFISQPRITHSALSFARVN